MRVAVVFDLSQVPAAAAGAVWRAASFAAEEAAPGRWGVAKDDHGAAPRVLGTARSCGAAVGEHLARTAYPDPAAGEPVPRQQQQEAAPADDSRVP